jgi:hypothetical protein
MGEMFIQLGTKREAGISLDTPNPLLHHVGRRDGIEAGINFDSVKKGGKILQSIEIGFPRIYEPLPVRIGPSSDSHPDIEFLWKRSFDKYRIIHLHL